MTAKRKTTKKKPLDNRGIELIQGLEADKAGYNAILNLPLMGTVQVFGCRVLRVAGGGYVYIYPNSNLPPTVVAVKEDDAKAELLQAVAICEDLIKGLKIA